MANLVACQCAGCGTKFRLSQRSIDRVVSLTCPVCVGAADVVQATEPLTDERRRELRAGVLEYVEGLDLSAINRRRAQRIEALKRQSKVTRLKRVAKWA